MDGAPAIVWGTNPENGKFFVGLKAVFNKVKVKICYTHEDVVKYYGDREELLDILQTCLDFLPRTKSIYQGDFIGFGGQTTYKPNTITYKFPERVNSVIIIAPHTEYTGETLKTAVAAPLNRVLDGDEFTRFIQPTVDSSGKVQDIGALYSYYTDAKFLDEDAAKEAKIIINAFIREGKELTHELLETIFDCEDLAFLYLGIMEAKEDLMDGMIVYDGPKAFIDDEEIGAEGYVRHNKYGSMKLVDRFQFAYANFNQGKFQ